MKKITWIIFLIFSAFVFSTSCSNNEENITESGKSHLIKDGKIYIDSYASKGMTYSPIAEKSLPECIRSRFDKRPEEIKTMVFFEGEYNGSLAYWSHSIWSSCNYPLLFSIDGKFEEDIPSIGWGEIDYTKLTCIYFGEKYALYHMPI